MIPKPLYATASLCPSLPQCHHPDSPDCATLQGMVALLPKFKEQTFPGGEVVWEGVVSLPSPPVVGRAQETQSTGVILSLLHCITGSENGVVGTSSSHETWAVWSLLCSSPVLYHSQGRNTRHFHSSAVCAELTSGQSLWPVCSTVTASHHTICMPERRDAGQVPFFPTATHFPRFSYKNNVPKPCKMLS